MPLAVDSEMIGRELSGYRIEAQIGHGGIGVVYRAYDPELQRAVALKLLRVDLIGPAQRTRFEREAKALTALAHRNIVAILDCGVSESIPFLVMELLDGETLADAVGGKPLPQARAVRLMQELLSALAFVHESGLVHRDLKPGNVFLERLANGRDGAAERVKLLDFGLAKFLDPNTDGGSTLTRTGEVFGTPAYMAPEQWSGDKVGPATDVYSAAILCFELLTGRRPFMSEGQELLQAQLLEIPPLVHEASADRVARPELERVLQRALSKRPSERQQNAAELAAELKAVPQPWLYEGREATWERRIAAAEARDSLHTTTATTLVRAPAAGKSAPARAASSAIGRFFHRFAVLSAWTLSIASLIVIGVAATMIYLGPNSAPPEMSAPVRALPERKATVEDARDASATAEPALEEDPATEVIAKRPALAAPREPARNPWQAPLPKELRPLRWKLEVGQEGDREMLKELKRYIRKQPKDPRGPLLLARLYTNRDQWDAAVAQYKVAFGRDPSSRGDPRMLKDLVSAASRKESSWRATDVIPAIYGREALDEIQRALRRTHHQQERLRLEQLAHTLAP
jgi:serine/threonine-protein kinase